jgi:hypothetical protein
MANDLKIAVDGSPRGFLDHARLHCGVQGAQGRLLLLGYSIFFTAKDTMKSVRTISMGVLKGSTNRGTDLSLNYHTYRNGVSRGYRAAEMPRVKRTI